MPAQNCLLCEKLQSAGPFLFENSAAVFVPLERHVLPGTGLIVPRTHCGDWGELADQEILQTKSLWLEVQGALQSKYRPAGFTLGWNLGPVAGQRGDHFHLWLLPRYESENYRGRGLDFWLSLEENRPLKQRDEEQLLQELSGALEEPQG